MYVLQAVMQLLKSPTIAPDSRKKNILVIYLYAARYLGIILICHKFLIKIHIQNREILLTH
ncbi:hypothetical protein PR048_001791 [Dryococelus australis]|uniref:Uncharacterized protein n=1 Tax=Dryococelus australis TaxID=614101 RepID=A0ABQ9IIA7_9NEOP|nr:hypothetical protein PR048_001791 [Dryococelus australis]